MPPKADKLLFSLAPMLAMIPVLVAARGHPVRRHDQHRSPLEVGLLQGRQPGDAAGQRRLPGRLLDVRGLPGRAALRDQHGLAAGRPRRRGAQRRPPLRLRDGGPGHRRRGDRRLVERQQVLAHGRAPRGEPDGQLRGHDGPHAHRRDDGLRLDPPRRHGPLAGRQRVGHLRPAARVLPVLHGRHRRDEAHPVRPSRGRERARVRLLHRVLGHEVRHVLLRRVHGGRDELDAPRHHLPRRLAAAVPPPRRSHHRVRRDRAVRARSCRTSG